VTQETTFFKKRVSRVSPLGTGCERLLEVELLGQREHAFHNLSYNIYAYLKISIEINICF
jgi:hypothetical protein